MSRVVKSKWLGGKKARIKADVLLKKYDKTKENRGFTDEEIFQLGKYDLVALGKLDRYLAEYYMQEVCWMFDE